MRQVQTTLPFRTQGQGLLEITQNISRWLQDENIHKGLLTLFCKHTSASLTIQENADPDVQLDLNTFFKRLIPEDSPWIRHVMEGADDMPAHIKSALTDVSLSIPVREGRMSLGTWQGVYLFEHRHQPHRREIVAHFIGK